MSREDLKRFRGLEIDFDSIGLLQDGAEDFAYFCTPVDAELVGRVGCDGIHFILLPGDERVYCVSPEMGGEGTYVLPVAANFREFLSFVLYYKDASILESVAWCSREKISESLEESRAMERSGEMPEFFARRDDALETIAREYALRPAADPYDRIRALQSAFDPSILHFSDEYYDVLGIERK